MRNILITLLSVALLGATGMAQAQTKACASLLPETQARAQPRDVTALDIARLRDFGKPDNDNGVQGALSLSPDGRTASFILLRADPARNAYCRALVIVAVDRPGRPRILDMGGDPIFQTFALRGVTFPSGVHRALTPRWSPDGRRIAYLRRDSGRTRAWVASLDGETGHAISSDAGDDVEDVAWSDDGRRLIIATRPDLARADRAITAEGQGGYLFDRRILPIASARPFPPAPLPYAFLSIDLQTGAVSPASAQDAERLPHLTGARDMPGDAFRSRTHRGWRVWLKQTRPDVYPSPETLFVEAPNGTMTPCDATACASDVSGAWWDDTAGRLLILRREGWGKEELGLYSWRRGEPARRLLATRDVLISCAPHDNRLICLDYGSARPGRLVAIGLRSGAVTTIFDPNPEFAHLRLGAVERLRWKTPAGVEGFGDLVLPPSHRRGERHPLVVVQYRTRGFLRGGTGDEYPIFALAARGLAVLSFDCPPQYATAIAKRTYPDWIASAREDTRGWNDRRTILQSLEAGVDMAVAGGAIDPERIGLTGLSDGATTAQFALVNSDRFKAVAVSSCCEDPRSFLMLAGEAFSTMRRQTGFPSISSDVPDFWKDYAISLNAKRIDTPILMQLSDDEYLLGLEAYWALKDHEKPVEMHIFPHEFHIKWQPQHRLAIYERVIDWFAYWLQDVVDPAPAKADQYARWRILRTLRDQTRARIGPATRSQLHPIS